MVNSSSNWLYSAGAGQLGSMKSSCQVAIIAGGPYALTYVQFLATDGLLSGADGISNEFKVIRV
jgi:hypothetical protein